MREGFRPSVHGNCSRYLEMPEMLDADFGCWRVEMADGRMFGMTIAWRCRKSEILNPPNAETREGNEI